MGSDSQAPDEHPQAEPIQDSLQLTGSDATWRCFDSKATTYPELCRRNQRGSWFATIRRRGTAVVRRLRQLPASSWHNAVIDTPKRFHQHSRYVDDSVR